jgi:hypothetical protein
MDAIVNYIGIKLRASPHIRKRFVIYTNSIEDLEKLKSCIRTQFPWEKLDDNTSIDVVYGVPYVMLSDDVKVIQDCCKYDHILFYKGKLNND